MIKLILTSIIYKYKMWIISIYWQQGAIGLVSLLEP